MTKYKTKTEALNAAEKYISLDETDMIKGFAMEKTLIHSMTKINKSKGVK